MAIGLSDAKILWGRAGGRCSNPDCRADVTKTLQDKSIHYGEMAHVIANAAAGPRGDGEGGNDTYENLILLCSNCHTLVDKAPESYSRDTLLAWKKDREDEVIQAGTDRKFSTLPELKFEVGVLLAENKEIFTQLGPKSQVADDDPGSSAVTIWEARKMDTILPNNRRIINLIGGNLSLASKEDIVAFLKFKSHARAFEEHQYDKKEFYPLFPVNFEERFGL